MSYDMMVDDKLKAGLVVSIPLEQGNVLRQRVVQKDSGVQSQSLWNRAMSYDFYKLKNHHEFGGLNPFGTGQCLTTLIEIDTILDIVSQSLWNRAMSYDICNKLRKCRSSVSIPLEQGNVLRHRISCNRY